MTTETVAAPAARASGPATGEAGRLSPADTYLSAQGLSRMFGLPFEPLRKRLDRWRRTSLVGWFEHPEPDRAGKKLLYQLAAVEDVVREARAALRREASSSAPG